ncbi:TnsD family transposase [Paenibacillus sp. MSJ-6]|uniref:TnsD family transposase n=1 Tax=Paenibacillus brevis TaxID=2841508 RepID=A0ABS6FNL0_9BACL|nr:TnsD family transposase [Paenibacillus brevis]
MVAHFPSLYPDELLYSGIARYHQMSGNTSQKQTVRDLFGKRLVCATVDLPSHLGSLTRRLGGAYTVEELVQRHTLYPYYTTFVSKDKAEEIYCLMAEGKNRGEAHVSLGIPASTIKLPANLRYCRGCYRDDVKRYGEPYWHRLHQLPGVLACPIHKMWLSNSAIPYTTREQKFGFQPLSTVKDENEYITYDFVLGRCLRIAKRSEILLSRSFQYVDLQSLIRRDYVTNEGRFRFRKLLVDFDTHFTPELLKAINCEVKRDYSETWLHKIIRGKVLVSHPLRYILISEFLGLDPFQNAVQRGRNMGRGRKLPTEKVKRLNKVTQNKDWAERDAYFRLEVKKAVTEMKAQKIKPPRITVAAISRHIGHTKFNILLEKCLNKLPLTESYISQELETTEKYQIRRLECATSVMKEQGFKVQGWRLLKAAGLNHPLAENVEAKFQSLIKGHDDFEPDRTFSYPVSW